MDIKKFKSSLEEKFYKTVKAYSHKKKIGKNNIVIFKVSYIEEVQFFWNFKPLEKW